MSSPTTRSGTSRSSSTSTACVGSTSPSSSYWSGIPTDLRRIAFRPDFYLPDHACFIELTTLSQKLVTRKNAKVRRLRELHPGVEVKLLYQRDYQALLAKYGFTRPSSPAA